MENYIIIAIIAAMVFLGIRSSIKHFKGQGGCCGGGSYRPKRKRLKGVLYQKTFQIEGMHCEHCKNRVEEAVNEIPGAAGRVNLKKAELKVSYAEEMDDERIIKNIEKAGYRVIKAGK